MRDSLSLSFAALLILLSVDIMIETNAVSDSSADRGTLRFLLLGDWGKGGNSGSYVTSLFPDNNDGDFDDDDELGILPKSPSTSTQVVRGLKNSNKATYQAVVANAMGSYSSYFQPSFVIALGDNFYTNGVSSSTDAYWDYLWTNVYLDSYQSLRIPWYPVFGKSDALKCILRKLSTDQCDK